MNDPQCGCGEPIEFVDGGWRHVRRRLDRKHAAELQLDFQWPEYTEPYSDEGGR